jgi:hypothetical protein
MVVVTHNRSLAKRAHQVYKLEEGRLAAVGLGETEVGYWMEGE